MLSLKEVTSTTIIPKCFCPLAFFFFTLRLRYASWLGSGSRGCFWLVCGGKMSARDYKVEPGGDKSIVMPGFIHKFTDRLRLSTQKHQREKTTIFWPTHVKCVFSLRRKANLVINPKNIDFYLTFLSFYFCCLSSPITNPIRNIIVRACFSMKCGRAATLS